VGFLLRRITFYLVTAWAAITLNFLIPRLIPGNPALSILGKFQGNLPPSALKTLQALLGLNSHQGELSAYFQYLGDLAHGNLGLSAGYYPATVSSLIASALPWTIGLIGTATVISFVLGTVIGSAIAWRRGSRLEWLTLLITVFLNAMPYFWLGLVVIYVLAVRVHWFPLSGGVGGGIPTGFSFSFIGSVLWHGALPALTIVATSVAGWILSMRNMTLSVVAEDYVLLAEAKGLSKLKIRISYAGRNAILPNLAGFALSLGFVVAGAIVTEIIFSYPGIGYLLFEAVQNNDYSLMQGVFLVITLSVLGANLLADAVYLLVDPRTRQGAQ
jgi:peptide/nickel transport system permease protein